MSAEIAGRKITELRACDLKDELVKRKLNNTGLKNELMERLQDALREEGKDPEKYLFPPLDKRGSKIVSKKGDDDAAQANESDSEKKNGSLIVDEVGTVDGDEQELQDQVDASAENVNDNEESLNLTIGEEEQKLFHEEEEHDEDKEKLKEPTKVDKQDEEKNSKKADKETSETSNDKKEPVEKEDTEIEKNNEKAKESENKTTSKSKDEKEKTTEAKSTETKSTNNSSSTAARSHRNLWVSGLTSITRASDLKSIFSKYGKVIGAKVVTNTRTPGSRCYGYVTMGSSSEATRCIEHLHGTELHGRIISVERTKNEIGNSKSSNQRSKEEEKRRHSSSRHRTSDKGGSSATAAKTGPTENGLKDTKDKENIDKNQKNDKDKAKEHHESDEKKKSVSRDKTTKKDDDKTKTRSIKSASRTSMDRKKSRDRRLVAEEDRRARERREREILTYKKIREERERQRLREKKEREMREEERRRREQRLREQEEDRRRREIRRRQREEEERLAREREKLALERERLEREKAELLRLERERQKLEREKIELERLELKRQQMKIMEQNTRIDDKRPTKRSADDRYGEVDRKRTASDRRFEAPPPPRFDSTLASSGYDRSEKKRDDYVSSSKRDDYTSKRDDYVSSKRDDYSKRDEYPSKRSSDIVVPPPPPRHSSGYHSSHGNREGAPHKNSRYVESEVRPTSYRSGRSPDRDPRASGAKRYEVSSSYSERPSSSVNAISSTAPWHASGGSGQSMKSFTGNSMPTSSSGVPVWQNKGNEDHWGRTIDAQDRYDRTYNERGGGYGVESSRSATMFGGRPDGRYSGQISSRY